MSKPYQTLQTPPDSAEPTRQRNRAACGEATDILAEPLKVGQRQAPNRIVFGAHITNFGHQQRFSPRHAAYYAARVAGGAGILVSEALTVHPLDYPYEHIPFGHEDDMEGSLSALGETLRAAAAGAGLEPPLLLAQLNHTGGQTSGRLLRQSPWAPSPVPDVASKKMSRAMDQRQIAEVVAGFAQTAARVVRAGWDGVEINAGQQSLLRQFLSPLTNQREDEYGGELAGRLRLLLRVLTEVRDALVTSPPGGKLPLLGVKLCGDELAPWGGLTVADAQEMAGHLIAAAPAGGVDYLSMQIGGPYSVHVTEAAMPMEQGHAAHLAAAVRKATDAAVPVFAEGRIESPALARDLLRDGRADAVVMTRALISDAELPHKAMGRDPRPIRPHVGMSRYFSVQGDWNRPLSDLANPRAGRELTLGSPPYSLPGQAPVAGGAAGGAAGSNAQSGPVLVIGGGPAGLEAATTLAAQGSTVHLVEAAQRPGGLATALAARVPARAEFAALVAYQEQELARLGVRVECGRPLAGYEPWMAAYPRILLATGARSASGSETTRAEKSHTEVTRTEKGSPPGLIEYTPRWLFTQEAPQAGLPPPTAGTAVVIDTEYGFRMANAVEWLLAAGYAVQVLTEDFFVGRELVESGEFFWFQRVAEQGASFHPRTRVRAIEPGVVTAEERFSGQILRLEPVAFLVRAAPEVPEDTLAQVLATHHPRVETIGDARAPRLMGEATAHAYRTGVSRTQLHH